MAITIVLDNIRSAWNVGSIFRTCDALGYSLILVGYTPRPIGSNLKLIKKTAIGAEQTVAWEYFEHWQEVFATYPDQLHVAIEISPSSQNAFSYLQQNSSNPKLADAFLWFGNEIHGINEQLARQCDYQLHLPMNGMKESLNVASCVCAIGYMFQFTILKS